MKTDPERTGLAAPARSGRCVIRWSWFVVPAALAAATLLDQRAHALFVAGTLPAIPKPGFYLLNAFGVAGLWLVVAGAHLLIDGIRARFSGAERTLVRAAAILAPVVIAGLAGEALKIGIRRERPLAHGHYVFREWGPAWDNTSGLGLPSTHAAVAFAAVAALTRLHRRGAPAWYVLAAGCLYTRLQPDEAGEAAHFLSDVVAGAALGWIVERVVNRELVGGRCYADGRGDAAAMSAPQVAVREPLEWMSWPATIALALVVLAVRIGCLRYAGDYELSGCEALAWDSSRHFDRLTSEPGAGLPLLIAASTRVFGVAEWTVRLPSAVLIALATLVSARTARCVARGDARAGFIAAAMFSLVPAYQSYAHVATPDVVLLFGGVLGCWGVLSLWCEYEAGLKRRAAILPVAGMLLAVGLIAIAARDIARCSAATQTTPWILLLTLNPALLLLIAVAATGARLRAAVPMQVLAGVALVAALVGAFGAVTSVAWIRLALVPLIPLAAIDLVPRLSAQRRALATWRTIGERPRPWLGRLRRRPETPVTALWDWTVICGVAGWLAISFADVLAATSLIGPHVDMSRFDRARVRGSIAGACAKAVEMQTGQRPDFLAADAQTAALTAFYLPGRPLVRSADLAFGGDGARAAERTTPVNIGERRATRDLILIGGTRERWTPLLNVEAIETLDVEHGVHVGYRDRGSAPH